MRSTRPLILLSALLLTLAPVSALAQDQDHVIDESETGITRNDLGITQPGSAPGEELGLWQYSIPAGSILDAHTHPGWQVVRITDGELEYTVLSGMGTLIHEDGSSEMVGPGTYTLRAGGGIVENPGLEHFAANKTSRQVEIVAATLYPEGAPLSIPLASPLPEASPAS